MAIAELIPSLRLPASKKSPATAALKLGDRQKTGRASRWWLLGTFALALAAVIPEAFGRQFVDTKLDLTTSPVTLLSHLLNLWDPNGWFGFLQDQYQGYAFPIAPFFALGHVLAVPPWITERVWMAALVTVAFWGVVRLAEALEIGSLPSRLAGGLVYALWPTFTVLVGINSAALAPGVLLPWVLIPLVKGCKGGSTLRAAALSGLAVLFMGGVNAADTADILIVPALFLLTRQPSPRRRSLSGSWVVCVGLATMWWLIPLLFLGKYGFNFLPYTEQAAQTTSTMSSSAVLQGTGDWVSYLSFGSELWDPGGSVLVTIPVVIFGCALTAAVGLFGLARRDLRERRFLLLVSAVAVVLTMSAYWGPLGGPFGQFLRPLLNTTLAPFRNVYKFEPLLALPLTLGIVHTLDLVRTRVKRSWSKALAVALTVAALLSLASPYLLGRVSTPNSFSSVPNYWYQTADYLAKHAPHTTALVVPASAHGLYQWGWTVDEPLEAIGRSPWVDREVAPYSGAGSTRVIDAINAGLRTGLPQPGLNALLERSGISYVVVQNDSEWQLSDSPSPSIINSVLNGAGLTVATTFGPTIETDTGNNPTLSIVNSGYHVPYHAIQIFKVHGSNSPIQVFPTSTAARVTGGPEADLQLFGQGVIGKNQAVVLAGDEGGRYTGPLLGVTDTLRRENYDYGLVNDNFSYPLTTNQLASPNTSSPDGMQQPRQMLPFPGVGNETVAKFVGAKSVDASSYGSWDLSLPEYNPANVFENHSSIGWTSGSPNGSVGQWLQVSFVKPREISGTHITLLASGERPMATAVNVTTNRGSIVDHLMPNGRPQPLHTPAGRASWLRVTFAKVEGQVIGGGNAGIKRIAVPGLHVQPYLKAPQEASANGAKQTVFSFAATQVDPTAILRADPEPVLARTFSTAKATQYTVKGAAAPAKGAAIDSFLDTSALHVTATSTFDGLPSLRPENLFDNEIATDWIASGRSATLSLSWPAPQKLTQLTIVFAQKNIAAKPKEILLSSPFGSRLLHVSLSGGGGIINFPVLDTNQLKISFPEVQHLQAPNALGGLSPKPLGLAELEFPTLQQYAAVPVNLQKPFVRFCGSGPEIAIDGRTYQSFISGTYADLYNLQPLNFEVCRQKQAGEGKTSTKAPFATLPVQLGAGNHYLITSPTTAASSPFTVTGLTMSSPSPKVQRTALRSVSTVKWGAENRTVRVGPGTRSYLEIHQNFSTGWVASLNGRTLEPIVLDGWQQGYIVPPGAGGVVKMTFKPESLYLAGLLVGALGVALLALLLILSILGKTRVGRWGSELPSTLPWTRPIAAPILMALSAAVIFVVGGPVVLVVVPLIVVGRRRPNALPWIAGASMVLAGVASACAVGNGAQSATGAFGPWAQFGAVLSIAAILVPVTSRASRNTADEERPDQVGEPVASSVAPSEQVDALVSSE